MTLEAALNLIRSRDDCVVLPPSGVPTVGPRPHSLLKLKIFSTCVVEQRLATLKMTTSHGVSRNLPSSLRHCRWY